VLFQASNKARVVVLQVGAQLQLTLHVDNLGVQEAHATRRGQADANTEHFVVLFLDVGPDDFLEHQVDQIGGDVVGQTGQEDVVQLNFGCRSQRETSCNHFEFSFKPHFIMKMVTFDSMLINEGLHTDINIGRGIDHFLLLPTRLQTKMRRQLGCGMGTRRVEVEGGRLLRLQLERHLEVVLEGNLEQVPHRLRNVLLGHVEGRVEEVLLVSALHETVDHLVAERQAQILVSNGG